MRYGNIIGIVKDFHVEGFNQPIRPMVLEISNNVGYASFKIAKNDMIATIDFVEKNFDNVGCEFAKEALKIHYGAAEPRNIRGVSTKEEEKTLTDEGIQFIKIPIPARPDTDS